MRHVSIDRAAQVEILLDGDPTVDPRWYWLGDNVRLLIRAYEEAVRRFSAGASPDRLDASLRSSAEVCQFYEVNRDGDRVSILMRDSIFREPGPKLLDELELRVSLGGAALSLPLPLDRLRALGRLLPLLARGCPEEQLEETLGARLSEGEVAWTTDIFRQLDGRGLLARGAAPVNRFSQGVRPRLSFLGHTGLLFESPQGGVALDPLLWRQTGLSAEAFDAAWSNLSAVGCTHAHWDHFFPAALLWFDKDLPIVIPKVRRPTAFNPPMVELLQLMGFTDIREAEHWKPIQLGDIEFIPTPFHGEQDEPEAEIDHYSYVLRTDGLCVFGGVDSFQDTFGSMIPVLERIRDEYRPQVAALPVSRMIYHYRWGGVNAFCRYLDSDLLDKSFQYTAGPAEGAAWTRLLGVQCVTPYALFVMKRWEAHPHINLFRAELRKLGLERLLYPLRPLDSLGPDDLAGTFSSRLRRTLLLALHSLVDAGRAADRRLSRSRLYRAMRWAVRRALPSRNVEHH